LYNRQSKVFNIPFLLRLAVAIEEGLFFIVMNKENFLEILGATFIFLAGVGFWLIVLHFIFKYW